MRKNNESDLRFAWLVFVAVVTTAVLLAASAAICFHDVGNGGEMSKKKSLWEGNIDEEDAFDMFEIPKKYRVDNI